MIREMTPEVREFLLNAKWPGVLSTLSPSGAPITSAVWFGLVGDDIIISTPAARPKARNTRLDPRVSFVVDTKERPYRGVAIEGVATVIEEPDRSMMRSIAERYLGPELPQDVEQRIAGQDRALIRIKATRIRPWNITVAN